VVYLMILHFNKSDNSLQEQVLLELIIKQVNKK